MKKNNDNEPRVVVAKLDLTECEHGNMHITDVEVLADTATVYEAPDAPTGMRRGLRWSHEYVNNWARTFGPKPPPEEMN